MGVKTNLTKKDLKVLNVSHIKATKNGVSDTVYILDKKRVLKLFENSSIATLKNEIKFLKWFKKLPVSKLDKKKVFYIKNKPCLLYKKCKGNIVKNIKTDHIKQIAKFLKQFHKLSKEKKSNNKMIFDNESLKKLIKKTKNKDFVKVYNLIDLQLKNDGVIHGDLFVDNILFKKKKLMCVIDFSEACNGDFLFDLAVVALSWCNTKKQIKTLLKCYDKKIKYQKLQKYIKFALLYYSVTRYIDNRNYRVLFDKIDKY